MKPLPPLLTCLIALTVALALPAQPRAEGVATDRELHLVASSLDALLNILAENGALKIENRARRPVAPLSFTSPKPMPRATMVEGITELLALRGLAVSRRDDALEVEDAVDPSEALILGARDQSLHERLPLLTRELAQKADAPVNIAALDMPLEAVVATLELMTGRTLLLDSPLPPFRFTCGESSMQSLELLTAIDARLVKQHILLIEHDHQFVKVVYAPTLVPGDPAAATLAGEEARARMQRVADEIRRRREMRAKLLEKTTDSPGESAVPPKAEP